MYSLLLLECFLSTVKNKHENYEHNGMLPKARARERERERERQRERETDRETERQRERELRTL